MRPLHSIKSPISERQLDAAACLLGMYYAGDTEKKMSFYVTDKHPEYIFFWHDDWVDDPPGRNTFRKENKEQWSSETIAWLLSERNRDAYLNRDNFTNLEDCFVEAP